MFLARSGRPLLLYTSKLRPDPGPSNEQATGLSARQIDRSVELLVEKGLARLENHDGFVAVFHVDVERQTP
jgi:hypothetical protein